MQTRNAKDRGNCRSGQRGVSLENKIYQQIVELKNWKNWHPVFMLADPKAIKFSTPSFGKDANCDILNNSKPTHLIFTATDSNSIKFSLATKNEEEIENEIAIIPIPNQAAQQVKWQSTSKLKWYPWEKFYGIFIDKLSGPGYEAALEGLKKYVE